MNIIELQEFAREHLDRKFTKEELEIIENSRGTIYVCTKEWLNYQPGDHIDPGDLLIAALALKAEGITFDPFEYCKELKLS